VADTTDEATRLARGAIVRHPDYPQWGSGYVIRAGKRLTKVFFLWGGLRGVPAGEPLAATRATAIEAPLFALCSDCSPQAWSRGHHSLYAVELDREVLKRHDFISRNPGGAASGCLYVGVTGLKPETRFERHLQGTQSARLVKKYGLRLRLDLVEGFSRLPYPVAACMEPKVAAWLRAQGFGVWQN
jgi:hypothetical protein